MSLLDRLEKKIGWLSIPNLTLVLCCGQIGGYAIQRLHPEWANLLPLVPAAVARGEWWRVITYLFVSRPSNHPLLLFFALYLFYLMGNALDRYWGTFRYNIYVGICAVATAASAFLFPQSVTYSEMIAGSVFLAFAWLVPDFRVSVFFMFPVPIRFLATITWLGFVAAIIWGDWSTRVAVLASITNFLIFFARPIWYRMHHHKRRMEIGAAFAPPRKELRHRCTTCGITNVDNPDMEFRYCSQCKEPTPYCPAHLNEHEHT